MECDICVENFDHLQRIPLLLFRCAHTLCASCVEKLVEKKCPCCNGVIQETRTNWSLLSLVMDKKLKDDENEKKVNFFSQ